MSDEPEIETAYIHAWADCCDGYIRPGDQVIRDDGVLVHVSHEEPS